MKIQNTIVRPGWWIIFLWLGLGVGCDSGSSSSTSPGASPTPPTTKTAMEQPAIPTSPAGDQVNEAGSGSKEPKEVADVQKEDVEGQDAMGPQATGGDPEAKGSTGIPAPPALTPPIYVDQGNVGIGISKPKGPLHVAGPVFFSNRRDIPPPKMGSDCPNTMSSPKMTNTAGVIEFTGSYKPTCTIEFGQAYPNLPACVVTGALPLTTFVESDKITIVFGEKVLAPFRVSYVCLGL